MVDVDLSKIYLEQVLDQASNKPSHSGKSAKRPYNSILSNKSPTFNKYHLLSSCWILVKQMRVDGP